MHTEENARKLWCPFARVVIDDSDGRYPEPKYPTGNRFGGYEIAEKRCLCIASDCAAWRWAGVRRAEIIPPDAPANWCHPIYPMNTLLAKDLLKDDPSAVAFGYCGLSGKPE